MEKRPAFTLATEPRHSIDFIALSMVLARPEFDVLGMCAERNVGLDADGQQRAARVRIKRQIGYSRPCRKRKAAGAPRRALPATSTAKAVWGNPPSFTQRSPACLKRRRFHFANGEKYAGRLEILSLGPLTDVALALQKSPEAAKKIARVVVMGGGIHAGNATKYAEFNIVADPEAAQVVFSSGVKTVMIGLDATNCCLQPRADIELLRADTALGQLVPAMLTDYADVYKQVHNLDGMIIHDAISAVYLWKPELFSCLPCRIEVCLIDGEHLGQTVPEAGDTCLAATSCDAQAVREEILSMMQQVIAAY